MLKKMKFVFFSSCKDGLTLKTSHPVLKYSRLLIVLLGVFTIFSVPAKLNISQELLLKIEKENGKAAVKRINLWQELMQSRKELPELEKLNLVNNFFNQRIEFVDDKTLWNLKDYWATPLEFLSKGAGDCEDYSIAKYFTLIELGVPENKMRLTYVKALRLNQAHMVLTYFSSPRAVPIVLDNLIPQIKKATLRTDLLPVYSFNGSGLWLAKFRGKGKKVGSSGRLNLWNELKERMLDYHAQ